MLILDGDDDMRFPDECADDRVTDGIRGCKWYAVAMSHAQESLVAEPVEFLEAS